MKKLLFAAYSLDVGGIETALVTLINFLSEKDYDITLVLEKKQGIFLNEVSKKVKIVEYKPCDTKNTLIRKVKNGINRFKFTIKHKNKYDCSIAYATYSLASSFVSRVASKNSILWVHSEYSIIFKENNDEYKKFFNNLNYNKFKKIVFVSNSMRENFIKIMGITDNNKAITINNLINYKKIQEKANEKIEDLKKEDIPTFLFVGRHTEDDKKISRLIDAIEMLKNDNMEFRAIIVGDGKDSENYKNEVKNRNLDDKIIFVGKKINPYPYFKISDCLVLTSEHEGFPVVYVEAMILNLPIITTNVSDSKAIIDGKYGIVVDKSKDAIYTAMKEFIEKGFDIKEKFDAEQYNKINLEKICKIIGKEN